MDRDLEKIVQRGVCLYGGQKPYHVIIIKSDFYYGTGDYEDDPDIADDREVETYVVYYEDLLHPDQYNAGGGQFFSLQAATERVEEINPDVRWLE